MIGKRGALSIAAYALSILARVLPLAFLPIYVRRLRFRHLVLGAAIVLAGVALYARSGIGLLSGLRAYAENWDYNSVLFPALRGGLERSIDVEGLKSGVTWFKDAIGDPAWCQALYPYVYPAPLARVLTAFAMIAGAVAIALRVARTERALFLATALLLVLTPTLHPWYVLWILPFAALEASVPWILFSGLAPLSYLSFREPDGRVPGAVLAIEWGVPILCTLAIAAWRRTRRRQRA
jgi:hypothetical protein